MADDESDEALLRIVTTRVLLLRADRVKKIRQLAKLYANRRAIDDEIQSLTKLDQEIRLGEQIGANLQEMVKIEQRPIIQKPD